jgi:hypothetical protein
VRREKKAQAIGLASQSDRLKSGQTGDRQIEDLQAGRDEVNERRYPIRPCSVLNSGL